MRPRIIAAVVAAVIGTTTAGITIATQASAAELPWVTVVKDSPGPHGAIAVIGDSVMLGSAYEAPLVSGWGPSLAQMLADRGWGPVRQAAGVGFQAGKWVSNNPGANMSLWVSAQRAAGFDPSVVAVSIGPNDMLACAATADPLACAIEDVSGLVDTIGADHEVWWALQTMEVAANQATWNQALQTVAAQRPNVTLWDWPAALAASGIQTAPDHTHLPGPAEYRARSQLMADDITTRMGVSRHVGTEVTIDGAGTTSYEYQPVEPRRVIDTRQTGQRLTGGATRSVDFGALPPDVVRSDATAVAVNVTAANPAAAGFLTVWPCDKPMPVASSVNFPAGQPRGALATSLLSQTRTLCVFSNVDSDVVVDLQGVFVPDNALRFTPITPDRKVDTRETGRNQLIALPAPAGARAVAATITVTGGSLPGFLAAFPCDAPQIPTVSNVNWSPAETVAGAAYIPVAADGTFCVFTSAPVDVIVDVTGVFGPASTLRFTPVSPTRMLDTRVGTGGWRGRQGPGQVIEIGAAPDSAVAVTGTITIVDPALDSYLTGTLCGEPPGKTSSVNGARGSVMANSLTVGLSPGGNLCIATLFSAHTLFDTTGWWAP